MDELERERAEEGWTGRSLAGELEARREIAAFEQVGMATAAEKLNEDRAAYGPNWAVVCDGIGSSGHGAEAAELVVDLVSNRMPGLETIDDREVAMKALADLLYEADSLVRRVQDERGWSMATTVSVVLRIREGDKDYLVVANVGDAPVYRQRGRQVEELTNYHEVLPERAERPGLGKPGQMVPEIFCVRYKKGDGTVVSSNGLRKNDPDMVLVEEILVETDDAQVAAERLVQEVAGISPDARTVVVLR